MAVNEQDLAAFEHLAYRIREDTHGLKPWDRIGTHRVFKEVLKDMHLMTAINLVVAHASDPDAKTPGSIKRPFTPKPVGTEKPDMEKCVDHPDEPAQPFCRIHKTEYARSYGELDDEERLAPTPAPQVPVGDFDTLRSLIATNPNTRKEAGNADR